jgi:hypothetical protein
MIGGRRGLLILKISPHVGLRRPLGTSGAQTIVLSVITCSDHLFRWRRHHPEAHTSRRPPNRGRNDISERMKSERKSRKRKQSGARDLKNGLMRSGSGTRKNAKRQRQKR